MKNIQLLGCGLLRKVSVLLAISFAIAFNLSAQVPSSSPARDAQGNILPAPAGAAATAERVIVTGSNIPTAEEVGPNPVETFSHEDIQKSGKRTTEEFLLSLPIVTSNVIPVSNNENGSNTAVGAAAVSLRGLDPRATLVLIDGRRVAPYPIGNNPGPVNTMFVDLNSIPQAAIESIEILKDGASTVYGADAVAGVVNLKMRHDYRGAEATIEYGNTEHDDSALFQASIIFGVGDDKTEIAGAMNYYHRNSIANRDRTYSAVPPFLSSNASPYNLQLAKTVVAAAGGTVVNDPNDPTGLTQFAAAPDFTNGLAPASAYKYGSGRLNRFNFNQFSLSFPSSERWGGYTHFEHKFCEDQAVFYGDFMYQNVQARNELAAPATGSFQTAGQVVLAIPPDTPIAPGSEALGTPTHLETGVPADAFNPFNPFHQIISGGTRARLAEFGNRVFDNTTDAYLATVGIKGDKLFDGNWGYDAGFRYSEVKNVQTGNQVSISKFNRILNAADPIFDPNSSQFIGTTVPFNPFGDFHVPIASNQATVAFATVHPKDLDTSKIWTIDGSLYTTSLFDLPAGGIGFAVGGQFRRESLDENPDPLNVAGDISGNSPVPVAHGGRKSFAFYAEANIPIFSSKNAIPGFHSLEITAAGRYEQFRNNDTDVAVPKFGIRWQPIDEQLTLRATWGQGFREPTLEELFAAPISGLKLSHDPQNGGAFEPETNFLVLSNKNLKPEDSETYSAGFVWTPKYIPGLTYSVDAWGVRREGVIGSPPADEILAREQAGTLLPGEVVERDIGGGITRITAQNMNLGFQEANGVDFTLQYQRPLPVGIFTFLTEWTWLYHFAFPEGETAFGFGFTDANLAGFTTDPGLSNEGWYKWRGTTRFDWAWKGFDAAATVRYVSGFEELSPKILPHEVGKTLRLDLQFSYDFSDLVSKVEERPVAGYSKEAPPRDGKAPVAKETVSAEVNNSCWARWVRGTTITFGINNVFDDDPPFASGEGGNAVGYPGFTYDATNRFWYWRLTKKF
jgi:outer membrane receptor protein involved in Fe transport